MTHHGFTGHEMLDDVGLIHMNGRVYDPTLGRFMQADPTVQSPGNPQNLNRYSYAGNNPLTYVDPSGYGFWSKLWKNVIRPIIAIAAAIYVGAYFSILSGYGFVGGIIGGFTGGIIASGGNLQAGIAGAITGGIFGGIGDFIQAQYAGGVASGLSNAANPWSSGSFNTVLAHAAGGGISSVLTGQKFGIGALSGGFSEGFSRYYSNAPGGIIGRTVAAATVGGTAARIGGGKFENGARTAAYAYLFNSAAHGLVDSIQTYSAERVNVLSTRMEYSYTVNTDRDTTLKQIRGVLIDTLAALKDGHMVESGQSYYKKIDTVQVEQHWYESGTNRDLGFEPVGKQYEVWDLSGTRVNGFTYDGYGYYISNNSPLIIDGFTSHGLQ